MIQREVAVRMAEPPGSREYGILSVLLQAWYDIEYLFTVGEKVFNPPPKVKSAVVRLRRNGTTRLGCDEALFVRVVTAAQDDTQLAEVGFRRFRRQGAPFLLHARRTVVGSRFYGADELGSRKFQEIIRRK